MCVHVRTLLLLSSGGSRKKEPFLKVIRVQGYLPLRSGTFVAAKAHDSGLLIYPRAKSFLFFSAASLKKVSLKEEGKTPTYRTEQSTCCVYYRDIM